MILIKILKRELCKVGLLSLETESLASALFTSGSIDKKPANTKNITTPRYPDGSIDGAA